MENTRIDLELVTRLVTEAVKRLAENELTIPVNISNRHVHLTEQDYKILFGELPFIKVKELIQPGEFASNRVLDVEGPRRTLKGVRVLGPFRKASQVELAKTDARLLGMDVPVRMSGDIAGTPAITLVGPAGQLDLRCGAIAAQRHIHMTPADAARFGLKNADRVDIRVEGERPVIFCGTVVRVRDDFALEMHIDTDEGNAIAGSGQLIGVRV